MSRRETATNLLAGAGLLTLFSIPVLLLIFSIDLLFRAFQLVWQHFSLPGIPTNIEFYGILGLWAVINGVKGIRRRFWTNSFLAFSLVAAIAFLCVRQQPWDDAFATMWPMFFLFMVPTERRLRRYEFILGAGIVMAELALTAGLLGPGTPTRWIASCCGLCAAGWFFWTVRRDGLPEPSTSPS